MTTVIFNVFIQVNLAYFILAEPLLSAKTFAQN